MEDCFAGGCAIVAALGYALQPFADSLSSASGSVSEKAPWFFPLVSLVMGAAAASFVGVVVHRVPLMRGWRGEAREGMTLSRPASHCDHCGAPVPFVSLIPVIGWFVSEGRCRECSGKVPWIYPAVEGATGFVAMALMVYHGPGAKAFTLIVLTWFLLLASWIDVEEHEIPDFVTVPLFFLGLLLSPFEADVQSRVVGALLAGGLTMLAFKLTGAAKGEDTMSLGDVALAGALGAWVGVCAMPPFLIASCLVYVAYAIPFRSRGEVWVPMAPALCGGLVLAAASGIKVF